MLSLQEQGAHNINLVSPSHLLPLIAEVLRIYRGTDRSRPVPTHDHLPIVYNSNGYDSVEILKKEMAGLIDIYLPDLKYLSDEMAGKYSGAVNYVESAKAAIREMHRQVGELVCNEYGIATKGLLVRHLVLPNNISGSKEVLEFLAGLSKDIHISLMAQYSPQYKASTFPELNRTLSTVEYDDLVDYAESLGLENVFIQELESKDEYLPDFARAEPFS
jgi:putative pyruvate formate lyase activating enzyme